VDRQVKLFNHLMNMEIAMKDLYSNNEKLKAQVKYLVQQRNASKLHCPTPFEREKWTRREKEEQIRKELNKIRAHFDTIRTFVDDTPVKLRANIAERTSNSPKPRSLLQMFAGYISPLFQFNLTSGPFEPKTVI
jgi:regulator of replication initiation timing